MDNFFINQSRLSILNGHILSRLAALKNSAADPSALSGSTAEAEQEMGYDIHKGIAIISIRGALSSAQIPGWHWFAAHSYEGIVATVDAAVNDPDVDRILLCFNSPGGTVTGCAEAAAQLKILGEKKEIWAHCNMADSAAYWLASATKRIIVDPTGEVGSIGVIMTHIDLSKLLEEWGVSIRHIFSGSHKADGSPYSPLSPEAEKRFQSDIDYLRKLFVTAVAENRGADAIDIHSTEALTYIGKLAVDAGLADATGFFSDVLKEMIPDGSQQQSPNPQAKEKTMTKKKLATETDPKKKKLVAAQEEPDDQPDDEELDDPEEDEPDAEDEDDEDEPSAEDNDEEDQPAASSEKKRISAILNCKEAKGRETLAKSLALDTNLSVKQAAKVLASSPKGATGSLGSDMRAAGNSSIGQDNPHKNANNKLVEDMKKRVAKK